MNTGKLNAYIAETDSCLQGRRNTKTKLAAQRVATGYQKEMRRIGAPVLPLTFVQYIRKRVLHNDNPIRPTAAESYLGIIAKELAQTIPAFDDSEIIRMAYAGLRKLDHSDARDKQPPIPQEIALKAIQKAQNAHLKFIGQRLP